jgi:hypothetical protein
MEESSEDDFVMEFLERFHTILKKEREREAIAPPQHKCFDLPKGYEERNEITYYCAIPKST